MSANKKNKLMKIPELRKRDITNLVIADVIEFTEGAFDVTYASDDGGTHIQISIENHCDASKLSNHFMKSSLGYRVLILKVPPGYLDV